MNILELEREVKRIIEEAKEVFIPLSNLKVKIRPDGEKYGVTVTGLSLENSECRIVSDERIVGNFW